MSAGGALAAALGVRHPELVHGGRRPFGPRLRRRDVGLHRDQRDAARSRQRCRGRSPPRRAARRAAHAAGAAARRSTAATMPSLPPCNAVDAGAPVPAPQRPSGGRRAGAAAAIAAARPTRERTDAADGARSSTTSEWRVGERLVARYVSIERPRSRLERRRRRAAVQRCARRPTRRRWSANFLARRIAVRFRPDDSRGDAMPATAMNHFTILTDDVAARRLSSTATCWASTAGPRPPFSFPGAWLYAGDAADPARRRRQAARSSSAPASSITWRSPRPASTTRCRRSTQRGVEHDCRRRSGRTMWQLFFHDPNGARVELDFAGDETDPRG